MMASGLDIWITGYGLVTPLGYDPAQIWRNLGTFATEHAGLDCETFRPYSVHVIGKFPAEEEIPQRADRRAMGPTFQAGVFAAARALRQAGIKGNPGLLEKTELIVACRCSDRDEDVDELITSATLQSQKYGPTLNKSLMEKIRPSLFLAQLPNILASNISIIFGVTGTSLTLMGEETAGANAIEIALQHLRTGRANLVLVGGVCLGHNEYSMLNMAASDLLLTSEFKDVWSRDGLCVGGGAAFLVLERGEHAKSRGAKLVARLKQFFNDRSERRSGSAQATGQRQWKMLSQDLNGGAIDVLSSACGLSAITAEEAALWQELRRQGSVTSVTGLTSAVGSINEAALPVNLAVGLCCLEQKTPASALSASPIEAAGDRNHPMSRILCNTWGASGGEAMALLEVEND